MVDIEELVKKLDGDGCPNCKAKIDLVDHLLLGARLTNEEELFDGPPLIVCLACGNGIRLVGPNRLPHRARRIP